MYNIINVCNNVCMKYYMYAMLNVCNNRYMYTPLYVFTVHRILISIITDVRRTYYNPLTIITYVTPPPSFSGSIMNSYLIR